MPSVNIDLTRTGNGITLNLVRGDAASVAEAGTLNGVTVSGTPEVDDIIIATSATTAAWLPNPGGSGGTAGLDPLTPITISAAGTTTIASANFWQPITVTTTGAALIVLSVTGRTEGDVGEVTLTIEEVANGSTITVRNANSSGTVLFQYTADGLQSGGHLFFIFNGTAWERRGGLAFKETTSPEFTGLKITGGSPGSGKVWTSDADGDGSWETPETGSGDLLSTNNLSDLASASTARTNLGLGTLATQSGTFSGTSSGTNTGNQTSIVGITGTLAEFNTACTDADFASTIALGTKLSSVALTIDSAPIGLFTSIELPSSGHITGGVVGSVATLSVAHAASTLTGTTLASGVTASSLTSVGTLTGGATGAGFTVALDSSTITGTLAAARLPATAALTTGTLAQFAATTSAQLAGVLSDETGTGEAVFSTSPTLVTPILGVAALTSGTATKIALGTTPAFAYKATNTTAAAAGAQQVSPSTEWIGQGWKTTATAASQEVKFQAYVLPFQGTTNPSGVWYLQASINGGAYSTVGSIFSDGTMQAIASFSATTTVTCGASSSFVLSGRARVAAASSGVITLQNSAATDLDRVQWGGTTSSFPAIKRSSATLQARLADDSAYADVSTARVIANDVVRLKGYTVAGLPTGTQGDTAFVTDALAPTFLAILVGGGSVVTTAFYNGTNWVAQ